MEKEKSQVEKPTYEKPALTKHGNLKEITAEIRFGSVRSAG